jgi:pimeloyl-ACP methyl ester carboxylesterase
MLETAMLTKHTHMHPGRVTTEGDDLYYDVRGYGEPLLMIAPAGGDGWQYAAVADRLAHEFKVITYNRRANARSAMHPPQNFEISQQSRDAMAVLHAAGEASAFVFGNSSGAVIALDMAKTAPHAVRAVMAHEPPLVRVQPHASTWQRFFARVYWTGCHVGSSLAALQFMLGVGLPVRQLIRATKDLNNHRKHSRERYIGSKTAADILIQLELLSVTNYLPDVEQIKRNGVRIVMAAGKQLLHKRRFYAETAPILAQQLGCELVTFPSHHGSFLDMPDVWAATLRDVLHQAEATC